MRSLLLVALLVAAPMAMADVPSRVYTQAAGDTREQPQAASHWQKMAEEMADQAAPQLKDVTLSARARGELSLFDRVFHDFLITALHDRGVRITNASYGARVDIDTLPVHFSTYRSTLRVSGGHPASADELVVNVRVFDGCDLAFSGSTTYYVPKADLGKYESQFRAQVVPSESSDTLVGPMKGRYGTATWGYGEAPARPAFRDACN